MPEGTDEDCSGVYRQRLLLAQIRDSEVSDDVDDAAIKSINFDTLVEQNVIENGVCLSKMDEKISQLQHWRAASDHCSSWISEHEKENVTRTIEQRILRKLRNILQISTGVRYAKGASGARGAGSKEELGQLDEGPESDLYSSSAITRSLSSLEDPNLESREDRKNAVSSLVKLLASAQEDDSSKHSTTSECQGEDFKELLDVLRGQYSGRNVRGAHADAGIGEVEAATTAAAESTCGRIPQWPQNSLAQQLAHLLADSSDEEDGGTAADTVGCSIGASSSTESTCANSRDRQAERGSAHGVLPSSEELVKHIQADWYEQLAREARSGLRGEDEASTAILRHKQQQVMVSGVQLEGAVATLADSLQDFSADLDRLLS